MLIALDGFLNSLCNPDRTLYLSIAAAEFALAFSSPLAEREEFGGDHGFHTPDSDSWCPG